MNPTERAALRCVRDAAEAYVAVVNNPPLAPSHKAQDAERRAFDALEEAVNAAVAAKPADEKTELKTFVDPEEGGAWS